MRTGSMIFSLLQVPRCRVHSLANYWGGTFHSLIKTYGNNSSVRLLGSRTFELEGGHNKKWNLRPITAKTEGSKQTTGSSRSRSTKHEIFGDEILTNSAVNVDNTQLGQFQEIQYGDIQQQETALNKNLSDLVTVIVFDLETTGFSSVSERIVEIALRDLQGGENSTFQALVNPQRYVPNSHIHGITTQMVNRPDVPRMEDLIPILLHYIQSRQKPGGCVLWVAHNAHCFDVPFLINEFGRCSTQIPPNWRFVDTLLLARELMKTGTNLSSTSLAALRELYRIKVDGSAHRAMEDVNTLSMILPRLTSDLKLNLPALVKKSFTESDLINSRRKKNSV